MTLPTPSFDVSPASSKQLTQPSSQAVPPAKLATIQSQAGTAAQKEDTFSHKEGSSGSSPRSEGAPLLVIFLSLATHTHKKTLHYHQRQDFQWVPYRMGPMLLARPQNLQHGLPLGMLQTVPLRPLLENHPRVAIQRAGHEVGITSNSAFLFNLFRVTIHVVQILLQVLAGNFVFDLSSSYQPLTEPAIAQQFFPPPRTSQCPLL